ncbi:MAG: tetratricopeptide repeat protein [Nitrospirae bacterium]|nr:tetratricopeptide repeat protein [Nitrospirota bacterium]
MNKTMNRSQKSEDKKIRSYEDEKKKPPSSFLNFSTSQLLNFGLLLFTVYCLLFTAAGCGHTPPSLSDVQKQAIEFNQQGESAFKKGHYKRALSSYAEALRLNRSIENTDGIAINLVNMAVVHHKLGDNANARKYADEILDTSRITHHASRYSDAAFIKAMLYLDDRNYGPALEWTERALNFCRDDCRTEGGIYNLKGRIAFLKSDFSSALTYAEKGLELNKKSGDKDEEANSLRLIAGLKAKRGEYEASKKLFEHALSLDKELGAGRKIAMDLTGIGDLFAGQGAFKDAMNYYMRAMSVCENSEDKQCIKDTAATMEKCQQDSGKK